MDYDINRIAEVTMLLNELVDTDIIEEENTLSVEEIMKSAFDCDEEPAFIFIDGNDDPFGINDVMLKMMELMDEKYDIFSGEDSDEPIIVDYTAIPDDELHEIIRKASLCVEFENEIRETSLGKTEKKHYLS